MNKEKETKIGIAFEKGIFTAGMTLMVWSFLMALTAEALDLGFIILYILLPPLGAFLIINSTVNILKAIRDGE
jgi:hypothetical protein